MALLERRICDSIIIVLNEIDVKHNQKDVEKVKANANDTFDVTELIKYSDLCD